MVTLAAPLLVGCGDRSGQDWLIASAKSPDSHQVARLWCADFCDVPGRLVLTLSSPDHSITFHPADVPFPPKGEMPQDDYVAVLRDGNEPDLPSATIVWTGPRSLVVRLPCPEVDVGKPAPAELAARGLRIAVASSAPCRSAV